MERRRKQKSSVGGGSKMSKTSIEFCKHDDVKLLEDEVRRLTADLRCRAFPPDHLLQCYQNAVDAEFCKIKISNLESQKAALERECELLHRRVDELGCLAHSGQEALDAEKTLSAKLKHHRRRACERQKQLEKEKKELEEKLHGRREGGKRGEQASWSESHSDSRDSEDSDGSGKRSREVGELSDALKVACKEGTELAKQVSQLKNDNKSLLLRLTELERARDGSRQQEQQLQDRIEEMKFEFEALRTESSSMASEELTRKETELLKMQERLRYAEDTIRQFEVYKTYQKSEILGLKQKLVDSGLEEPLASPQTSLNSPAHLQSPPTFNERKQRASGPEKSVGVVQTKGDSIQSSPALSDVDVETVKVVVSNCEKANKIILQLQGENDTLRKENAQLSKELAKRRNNEALAVLSQVDEKCREEELKKERMNWANVQRALEQELKNSQDELNSERTASRELRLANEQNEQEVRLELEIEKNLELEERKKRMAGPVKNLVFQLRGMKVGNENIKAELVEKNRIASEKTLQDLNLCKSHVRILLRRLRMASDERLHEVRKQMQRKMEESERLAAEHAQELSARFQASLTAAAQAMDTRQGASSSSPCASCQSIALRIDTFQRKNAKLEVSVAKMREELCRAGRRVPAGNSAALPSHSRT